MTTELLTSLGVHKSWHKELLPVFKEKFMTDILAEIKDNHTPVKANIFRCFGVPLPKVKIVMIGTEPYLGGKATGTAFGLRIGEESNSLNAIKDALYDFTCDPTMDVKFDQSLDSWKLQGILMLNSALTAHPTLVEQHVDLWRPFMVAIINIVQRYSNNDLDWVLLGKHPKKLVEYIDGDDIANNIILSPDPKETGKIYGNKGFGKVNNIFSLMRNKITWFDDLPF